MSRRRARRLYAKAIKFEKRSAHHERREDRLMSRAARHAAKAQHLYDLAARYDDLSREARHV